MSHLMETYKRLPVAFEQGAGTVLTDSHGKTYLDALSGIAVVGLGHAHPALSAALSAQAGKLLHTSNLYEIPEQSRLAERLCTIAGMDRAFFGNSGAEANEAAIKLARLKGHRDGKNNPSIIAMDGSFHGRTMATLSATGNRKVHAGFEPLLSGVVRAPFNDIDAVSKIADNNPDVVAVLVEPILGEGGIVIPEDDYLPRLRELCDANGWLLMLDEVQTGNARTGRFFAFQHTDIRPDVLTTAKGLGNGMPIGVCLARGEAAAVLGPGTHGSTFGGNPLACTAANTVLDVIEQDGLAERATVLGERMVARFQDLLKGCNHVADIRGRGLMLAVELDQPCPELVTQALDAGVLINVTQDCIVRMLPPLTMSDAEADAIVDTIAQLVRDL